MRKIALLGTVLCSVSLLGVVMVQAQNQVAPAIPELVPVQKEKSLVVSITPTKPGSDHYDIRFRSATIVQMIEELARVENKKVLISDEVRAQADKAQLEIELRDIRPVDFLNFLANRVYGGDFGIAWGTSGPDTWLVVKRPATSITTFTRVPLPAPAPATPKTFVLPDINKSENMPPGSAPFWFNGQKLYVVPLQK